MNSINGIFTIIHQLSLFSTEGLIENADHVNSTIKSISNWINANPEESKTLVTEKPLLDKCILLFQHVEQALPNENGNTDQFIASLIKTAFVGRLNLGESCSKLIEMIREYPKLSLNALYENRNQSSDFQIKLRSGEVFPAHKAVLEARSSYFNRMFATSMKESREGSITINFEDIDKDFMESFIKFLYTHEINITPENYLNLFSITDYLSEIPLRQKCEAWVLKKIGEEWRNFEKLKEYFELGESFNSDFIRQGACNRMTLALETVNLYSLDDSITFLETHAEYVTVLKLASENFYENYLFESKCVRRPRPVTAEQQQRLTVLHKKFNNLQELRTLALQWIDVKSLPPSLRLLAIESRPVSLDNSTLKIIAQQCPSLEVFNFHGRIDTDLEFSPFKNLKKFGVSYNYDINTDFRDDHLEQVIINSPLLETLILDDELQLSQKSLKLLKELKKLKYLVCPPQALPFISSLPNLQGLRVYRHYKVNLKDAQEIVKLKNLKILSCNFLNKNSLNPISELQGLKVLEVMNSFETAPSVLDGFKAPQGCEKRLSPSGREDIDFMTL